MLSPTLKGLTTYLGGNMNLDEKEILTLQIILASINKEQMANLRKLLAINHKYVEELSIKLNVLPREEK